MGKPVTKNQLATAIAALSESGERVRTLVLRPGGEYLLLTDQLITQPISGDVLDDELAAFKAEHGYN